MVMSTYQSVQRARFSKADRDTNIRRMAMSAVALAKWRGGDLCSHLPSAVRDEVRQQVEQDGAEFLRYS